MGNILFCDKCENDHQTSAESVINLSDNCIDRLTKDEAQREAHTDANGNNLKLEDDEWMKKLKCLDDIHSNTNGLTIQALETLLLQVQSEIGYVRPQVCASETLILCLKKQEKCMIKCKKIMEDFIDSVDQSRIEIIKEKIECEKKLKTGEGGNKIAKEFFTEQ